LFFSKITTVYCRDAQQFSIEKFEQQKVQNNATGFAIFEFELYFTPFELK